MSNELTDAQVQDNLDLIKEAKTLEDLKVVDAVKDHAKIKPVLTAKTAELKAAEKKAADDKKAADKKEADEKKAAEKADSKKTKATGVEYVLLCALAGYGKRNEIVKLSADEAKRFGPKMVRKATADDKKKTNDSSEIDDEE